MLPGLKHENDSCHYCKDQFLVNYKNAKLKMNNAQLSILNNSNDNEEMKNSLSSIVKTNFSQSLRNYEGHRNICPKGKKKSNLLNLNL